MDDVCVVGEEKEREGDVVGEEVEKNEGRDWVTIRFWPINPIILPTKTRKRIRIRRGLIAMFVRFKLMGWGCGCNRY